MARVDCGLPLQKKIDVVVDLLTLIGAEKVSDDNIHILVEARRNPKNKQLCEAIVVACDIAMQHLSDIKLYLT